MLMQVSDIDELAAAPFSCFVEITPHRHGAIAELFPGSSSRHGGQKAAPNWWTDTTVDIRAQHLFKIHDVVLFPRWGVVVTAGGDVMRLTMEEALYASPDLSSLPYVRRTPDGLLLDVPATVERRSRAAVTMPYGATANYGHFLLDGVTGATALQSTGLLADFELMVPPLKPWQRRHFEIMNVEAYEIASDAIRVDEIIYTSAIHHFLHTPNDTYHKLRSCGVSQVGSSPVWSRSGTERSPRLLYLSRGADNTRIMKGETSFRKQLVAMGFRIVEPGTLSIEAQIATFHEADMILGMSGAGFANAVYCRPETVVIEIQPRGMENLWVQRLCVINGLASATWFCDAAPTDPKRPERGLNFKLDLPSFFDFLQDVLAQNEITVEPPRRSFIGRASESLGGLFWL